MIELKKYKKHIFNIIFSLVLLTILLLSSTKVGHELFIILVGLMIIESSYELVSLVGLKRKFSIMFSSLIYPTIIIIIVRVFTEFLTWIKYTLLVTIVYLILMLTFTMLSNGMIRIGQITQIISFSLYFELSLISLILLRYNYVNAGNLYYLSIFLISISTVLSFKFINKKIGKHKIFPKLKIDFSFEGILGSIIIALLIETIHGFILTNWFGVHINWIFYVIMTLICSIFTLVAKLFFLFVKKENDVLVFNAFIPNSNGLLEIYDGTLFICPIMYLIITAFNPIIFTI